MELHERKGGDVALIQAYGDGGFRLDGEFHAGSLLILPHGRQAWSPTEVAAIGEAALAPIAAAARSFDVLLIGTGPTMRRLAPALSQQLQAMGVAFETMATPAACRTYNVLVGEGRQVAAALIAIE